MGVFSFAQDLESLFTSYGYYHRNLINKLIHIVCVPVLLPTALAFLFFCPSIDLGFLKVRPELLILVAFLVIYIRIDLLSGLISMILYGSSYAVLLDYASLNPESWFPAVVVCQIVCWTAQFIGHGVFENRRPALVDNILLTIAAPQFVILEILFWLGYKADVHKACMVKILEMEKGN